MAKTATAKTKGPEEILEEIKVKREQIAALETEIKGMEETALESARKLAVEFGYEVVVKGAPKARGAGRKAGATSVATSKEAKINWLKETLKDGPMPLDELRQAAKDQSIAERLRVKDYETDGLVKVGTDKKKMVSLK